MCNNFIQVDNERYPNVDYWSIEVSKLDTVNMDTTAIQDFQLVEKSYMLLPSDYRTNLHMYKVKGLNSSHEVIVETDVLPFLPDGPYTSYTPYQYWTCNGATYAWDIIQYVHPNGGNSNFMLTRGMNNRFTSTAVPYYIYMNASQYNSITWASSQQELSWRVILDGNANTYYDASGTPINEATVYAIPKRINPYHDPCIAEDFAVGVGFSASRDQVQTIINNWEDSNGQTFEEKYGTDSLECQEALNVTDPNNPFDTDCLDHMMEWSMDEENLDTDVFDWLNELTACSQENEALQPWYELVDDLNIDILGGDDAGNGYHFTSTDLVPVEGNFPNINLNLNPGLYRIGVTANGYHHSFYREFRTSFSTSLNMSDYFNAMAYPNPSNGQFVNLDINCNYEMDVDVEVVNQSGITVHSSTLILKDNIEEDIRVTFDNTLPTGSYLCNFKFTDGSNESISLIVQQ